MSTKTGIEWTDATWNPIRGCSMVSAGCTHCYAQTVAHRFSGPGQPYAGLVQLGADGKSTGKWNGAVRFVEEHLLDPLRWKTPRRIFVNSMSDLFHENVTDEMRDRIRAVQVLAPQHSYQVLTKRPEAMRAYEGDPETRDRVARLVLEMSDCAYNHGLAIFDVRSDGRWPLPNVWLGVSVEDQKTADARIPLLLQTPAAVRFVSAEPLLGLLNLHSSLGGTQWIGGQRGCASTTRGIHTHDDRCQNGLDLVIVGGESGPGARPMHPGWARSLRDQCVAAAVPYFFKQWGEWYPAEMTGTGVRTTPKGEIRPTVTYALPNHVLSRGTALEHVGDQPMIRVGKKAAGDLLDGVRWHQMPEVRA